MRKLLTILAAVPLVVVACGDTDETDASDTTTAAPATSAVETTTAPETTAAPGTTAPAPTDAVAVEMSEWMVDTSDQLPAGPTTFSISNAGEFDHEFLVVRGTSYEELPKLGNGAVDEAALGDDVVGRSDAIDPGRSTTVELDLAAGPYVFLCNINVGPNSHAAQGQVLGVTVS